MAVRIISAVVVAVIALAALLLGETAIFVLLLLVNALALFEYYSVTNHNRISKRTFFFVLIGTALLVLGKFRPDDLFPCLPITFILVFVSNILSKKFDISSSLYGVWGITYISFFLSLALTVISAKDGMLFIYFILLTCYATDTFAYFFGSRFGRHKLCPQISPKKSVEGAVFGTLSSLVVALITGFLYTKYTSLSLPLYHYLLMALLTSVLGQFGDLAASMVKRKFQIKDYSDLIPGHGGMLDRIDSLLFSICAVYFYLSVVLNLI